MRTVPLRPELLRYDVLEREAKVQFGLGDRSVFLYYLDADHTKIALMSDADVELMAGLESARGFCSIIVQRSDQSKFGANNVELLKRRYLQQLNRKYYGHKDENYEQFKSDLLTIQSYLASCGLDQAVVNDLIQFLRKNTGFERMEQMLASEQQRATELSKPEPQALADIGDDLSVSSISRPEHSVRFSFISRTEVIGALFGQANSQESSSSKSQNNGQLDVVHSNILIQDEEPEQEASISRLENLRGSNGYRYAKARAMKRSLKLNNSKGPAFESERASKNVFHTILRLAGFYKRPKDKLLKK